MFLINNCFFVFFQEKIQNFSFLTISRVKSCRKGKLFIQFFLYELKKMINYHKIALAPKLKKAAKIHNVRTKQICPLENLVNICVNLDSKKLPLYYPWTQGPRTIFCLSNLYLLAPELSS